MSPGDEAHASAARMRKRTRFAWLRRTPFASWTRRGLSLVP